MSGLETLVAEGLQLLASPGDGSFAEVLVWHPVSEPPPPMGDDKVLLLWVRYADGDEDWTTGWLDGTDWCYAETGGVVNGAVEFWALPAGPKC